MRRQAEGDHALLLRRIGASDNRDSHDITAVDRQVRDPRRHVYEVAALTTAQPQARPYQTSASPLMDRRLMSVIKVGYAAGAGRDGHQC